MPAGHGGLVPSANAGPAPDRTPDRAAPLASTGYILGDSPAGLVARDAHGLATLGVDGVVLARSGRRVAGVTDALREIQYILVVANSDGKGRKPRRPEPIRRPGVAAKKPREAMSDAAAKKLFELINGGAA